MGGYPSAYKLCVFVLTNLFVISSMYKIIEWIYAESERYFLKYFFQDNRRVIVVFWTKKVCYAWYLWISLILGWKTFYYILWYVGFCILQNALWQNNRTTIILRICKTAISLKNILVTGDQKFIINFICIFLA